MSSLLDELRALRLVKTISFTNRETGERESRDVVLYDGLLVAAKRTGLLSIQTQLVQAPSEANGWVAITHARVELKTGVFTGIGDANPGNVNSRIKPAFVRMSETRAKARALRDAIDLNGVVCFEELDEVEREDQNPPDTRGNGHKPAPRAPGVNRIAGAGQGQPGNGNGHGASAVRPMTFQPQSFQPQATQPQAAPSPGVVTPPEPLPDSAPPAYEGVRQHPRTSASQGGKVMSERQRRFLFRLLAERGVEGQQAIEELGRALGTHDLRTASSQAASALIDQLTAEAANASEH